MLLARGELGKQLSGWGDQMVYQMKARDGFPLLGRPRGGVGGLSSLIDCSTNSSKHQSQATASADMLTT